MERKKYCVGGVWKESKTDKWMDVTDSSTGEVIAQVPCCTVDEVEEAIAAARAAYDALPERLKDDISNYDVLIAAENALKILLDEAAVNAVISAIDAIGQVTLNSQTAIGEARDLYDLLRDDLKAQITNYDVLTAAEAALAQLKQQAAVDETIAKIDAIGTVTIDSADAISAARPGARREDLDSYIKRLQKLEEIANGFEGVEKSYAIQAGREIRVIVKPEQVVDAEIIIIAHDIAKKIETELEYPGQIKVQVIRESRAFEYAK
jgi:hypothetical protein